MKNIQTTEEMFQVIKEYLFPDVDVKQVVTMTEEAQQTFLLEHLNRLFSPENIKRIPAWYSDLFWTADEGRRPMSGQEDWLNPLIDPAARMQMTPDEQLLCSFYVTLAGLCHDLYLHFPFDPMLLGIETDEDFVYSNQPLVKWVEQTPYRNIAAEIAATMLKVTLNTVTDYYQPAQDYLSEIRSKDFGTVRINSLHYGEVSSEEFTQAVMQALKTLEDHLNRGYEMGLCTEEIILHDEMVGKLRPGFVEWLPELVHELYQTLQEEYKKLDLSDFDASKPFHKQKGSVRRALAAYEETIIDKIHELQEKHELEGWFEDDSLAFSYLMEHAHMKLYGIFD